MMTPKKTYLAFAAISALVGLPLAVLHLLARPDDAPITPIQHIVAALANGFGPWGVAIVRWVDFPNAGLRSFSWLLALGLTALGAGLLAAPRWVREGPGQIALVLAWGVFTLVWFGAGFFQIADGLL